MSNLPTTNTPGLFEVFEKELLIRNYSPRTIKAYLGALRAFVRYFSPMHPRDLQVEDLHNYLYNLIKTELVSRSTIDQTISALKFLYNTLYQRNYSYRELPRPRPETKLPVVLSNPAWTFATSNNSLATPTSKQPASTPKSETLLFTKLLVHFNDSIFTLL